jgi:hypothetical protein
LEFKKYLYCLFNKLNLLIGIILISNNYSFGQQFNEDEVKAVYLFNFAKFVNWTNNQNNGNFIIGVYSKDPMAEILKQIATEKNKFNQYWIINDYTKPEEINNCNILYISGIKHSELQKILLISKNLKILTVGDNIDGFCESGGIINFQPKESSKPFEINNEAANMIYLKISPKLLNLAKIKNYR